ncbi:MAG: phosphotransferase [Candidatus Altiarchaeota archaeon]
MTHSPEKAIEDVFPALEKAFRVRFGSVADFSWGARSSVYRVGSGSGDLAVRQINYAASLRGLNFSHHLLWRLHKEGFEYVSPPLKNVGAEVQVDQDGFPMPYAAKVEGLLYSVSPWISGVKADGSLRDVFNAGVFLARYHQTSSIVLEDSVSAGRIGYPDIGGVWGMIIHEFAPEGRCVDSPFYSPAGSGDVSYHAREERRRVSWSMLEFVDKAEAGRSVVDDIVLAAAPLVEEASEHIRGRLHDIGLRVEYDSKGKVLDVVFPVPKAIAHGDYTPENVLFSKGESVGLVDFDLTGTRERVCDVAWGMLTFSKTGSKVDVRKATEFLRGYESITRLSKLEHEILPLEAIGRLVATTRWLPNQYYHWKADINTPDMWKNISLLRENLGLLKWVMNNKLI